MYLLCNTNKYKCIQLGKYSSAQIFKNDFFKEEVQKEDILKCLQLFCILHKLYWFLKFKGTFIWDKVEKWISNLPLIMSREIQRCSYGLKSYMELCLSLVVVVAPEVKVHVAKPETLSSVRLMCWGQLSIPESCFLPSTYSLWNMHTC